MVSLKQKKQQLLSLTHTAKAEHTTEVEVDSKSEIEETTPAQFETHTVEAEVSSGFEPKEYTAVEFDTDVDDTDYEDEDESDGESSVSLVDEDTSFNEENRKEYCHSDGNPSTIVVSSDEEDDGLARMTRYCSEHVWTPNPYGSIELKEGQVFVNAKHARDVIIRYAIQEGFELNKEKNDLCRYTVSCKNETCDWRIHTSRLRDGVTFMVKSITSAHNMCRRVAGNKEAKAKWVAKVMESTIQANPSISLKILHDELLYRYAVDCDLQVVYKAKKAVLKSLRVNHIESYGKVRKYANVIITMNPGSTAKVSVNLHGGLVAKFERFFLSFRAMQVGFIRGCRPFIGIDGCHLTSPFGGVMLSAIGLDGDNGIFPFPQLHNLVFTFIHLGFVFVLVDDAMNLEW